MRRKLQIAALACAMLLNGCWVSEEPLITQANSSEPLPAGEYTYHVDGEEIPLTLIKFPGGGYVYQLEEETLPILAAEISDDWYVLQVGPEDDLLYGVGHLTPTRFEIYNPECNEEALAFDGVDVAYGDCKFETIEALSAAGRYIMENAETGKDMGLSGWIDLTATDSAAWQTKAPAFAEAACGGCHGIEPPYSSPNPAAPPFAQIANRGDTSADALLLWLRDAHNYPEDMDFDLDEDQARELSKYIVSLREAE